MLDVATVRGWAGKVLSIADLVSQLTPFEADNTLVRKARQLVDSDPFMEVAVDGLNLLIGYFNKGLTEDDVTAIKAKFAELKGSIGQAG